MKNVKQIISDSYFFTREKVLQKHSFVWCTNRKVYK